MELDAPVNPRSTPPAHGRWWRYRIPFRVPFQTAHGPLQHREGVLVQLVDAAGRTGLGEVAPLPGFGGTLDDPLRWLREATAAASGAAGAPPATLAAALDTALLDLAAQAAGQPLRALLTERPASAIPVNATVGVPETARAAMQAAAALAAGFSTIKLKVGTAGSVAAEASRVAAVRAAIGPQAELRLDANAAWTPAEAIAIIRACAPSQPALVEQPVAAADIAGLAAVRRAVATPIAADEAVADAAALRAILAAGAADVIILKPALLGGLRPALALAADARRAGVAVIVTSLLDTGVGIAAAAQLAAALPPPLPACGLATAGLLETDLLIAPLPVRDGQLFLPEGPGLGVHLAAGQLERYSVERGEFRLAPVPVRRPVLRR